MTPDPAGEPDPPAPSRVALVTGAARGIGAATVATLVEAGWAVVATDACADDPALGYRLGSRAELEAVAAQCPDRIRAVVADVRDPDALSAAVDQARADFGGLDAAIACAGVLAGGQPAWESSEQVWQAQLEVNLTGVWRLASAAVPALIDGARSGERPGHASFVAVASAAATRGLPLLAGYSASKHGVIGLIRSMAIELGLHGVTANAVCPGSTRTQILDASAAVYDLDSIEDFRSHHHLDRLIEPAEIAATIGFLCSPGATAITGAVVPVDAGFGAG